MRYAVLALLLLAATPSSAMDCKGGSLVVSASGVACRPLSEAEETRRAVQSARQRAEIDAMIAKDAATNPMAVMRKQIEALAAEVERLKKAK